MSSPKLISAFLQWDPLAAKIKLLRDLKGDSPFCLSIIAPDLGAFMTRVWMPVGWSLAGRDEEGLDATESVGMASRPSGNGWIQPASRPLPP